MCHRAGITYSLFITLWLIIPQEVFEAANRIGNINIEKLWYFLACPETKNPLNEVI